MRTLCSRFMTSQREVQNKSCGRWSANWLAAARTPRLPLLAGSRVSGELFSTGQPCTQPDDYERRRLEHEDRVVEFVRRRAREGKAFDLVHDHSGSFWKRAAEIDAPVLATLHLPRSFYPEGSFDDVPANVSFNCVSDSQARSFADLDSLAGVVPNGIALDCFRPAMMQ